MGKPQLFCQTISFQSPLKLPPFLFSAWPNDSSHLFKGSLVEVSFLKQDLKFVSLNQLFRESCPRRGKEFGIQFYISCWAFLGLHTVSSLILITERICRQGKRDGKDCALKAFLTAFNFGLSHKGSFLLLVFFALLKFKISTSRWQHQILFSCLRPALISSSISSKMFKFTKTLKYSMSLWLNYFMCWVSLGLVSVWVFQFSERICDTPPPPVLKPSFTQVNLLQFACYMCNFPSKKTTCLMMF